MKICHVTSSHQRYDGRIFQKECVSLAKKYDVTLLCSDLKEDETNKKVKIHSIGINNKKRINRFLIIPRKLKRECLKVDADIYHFHDPELVGLALKIKRKGKKIIFDSHEDNVNRILNRSWIPKLLKPLVKKYYAKKERKVLSKVDAIITVADYIFERLSKINNNVYIITNYPIINNKTISDLKNNNVLCFAGGVSKQYMHHKIIKAIKNLDVKYKIAGPIFDNYFEILQNIDGIDKVDFLGVLTKEELDELYKKSGIGIVLIDYVPNINYKKGSLGITKIFEYMSYGLPIIATDLDVWMKFVPGNCGICVNPNDIDEIKNAICYLIDHPKIAKKMGLNGRKLVEQEYNWQTQEKILFDIYDKIINE